MQAASVFLTIGICALSASIPHSVFRYQIDTTFRRSQESCRLCYADDCINIDEARCQYYAGADEVLDKDEEDGEVTEIDGMMHDLMEHAAMSWTIQQCIPLISQYTDCTKDNVCIGCKICTCTNDGKWACNNVQRCRPDLELNVDHRTLIMVIEKLMEGEIPTRRKRSVISTTEKMKIKQVGLDDLADWMYGVNPNTKDDFPFSDVETDKLLNALVDQTEPFHTQSTIDVTKQADPENINFEEVLKNIAIDDQNYKRRKLQLKDNNNTAYIYMDLEDKQIITSNASDQFISVLNDIEEGKDVTGSANDAIVNLLPRNNYYHDDINGTDNMVNNNIIDKEEMKTIYANDIILDTVNVIKRDVLSLIDLNITTQATNASTASFETTTSNDGNVENNVLKPLTSIIDDKINEIRELMQIRENLVKYMKSYNDSGVNITSVPEIINSSSTYFSIYKLDLFPEIHEKLKKTNPNVIEKLLYKLKRDIHEVLRDTTRIQKISRTYGLPTDLKMLIRSMKYYVHEQGKIFNLKKKDTEPEQRKITKKLRMNSEATDTSSFVKSQLSDILEVLDKDKPQSNALAMLTKSTKKNIKRVIKENYVDDFSNVGHIVYDDSYNLTVDLRMIGKYWPQFTAFVVSSQLQDKLYAMKLLHFCLVDDINRIINAISVVNCAHSRRMTPLETPVAIELMVKVNKGLIIITNKINKLLNYHAQSTNSYIKATRKKNSFFSKLRNLLRNSKQEVIDLVNKDTPKSEIVRKIAQKKLDELTVKKQTEYEQTMLKWQRNLKTARRMKRHLESQLHNVKHNVIKNIIPKYLQGKINPALVRNRNKKMQSGTKKKNITSKYKILNTTTATVTTTTTVETVTSLNEVE